MNSRQLTKIAICIALLCVSAYISFPLPFTPAMVTAITIVINVIAFTLTPKEAFITVGIYLLMGIVGLPVFGGGASGISKILGPTGGYYFGFWIAPVVMSLVKGKGVSFKRYLVVTIFVGLTIIYGLGTVFMSYYQQVSIGAVIMSAIVPFIPGDLIKSVASVYISMALNRALPTLREAC